jgi:prepilin-type N-terminal cleavage/methylation domain-containing protein
MRRRAGFSLAEMMVTVLILGLIAAFSVPAVNMYLAGWNLQSSHNTVVSELKLLRERAIARGQSLRVWFSPTTNMYWFQNPKTFAWTMYRLPNRVIFSTVNFPGGPYDTYMQPDGSSKRAGTIIMRSTSGDLDTVIVDLSGWVGRP